MCSNVHSINLTIGEIEHLHFLFWIHTTFQYLRFGKGKRFELYLSLTGFQFSDFPSFFFLRLSHFFPELADLSNLVAMLDLSKLKILLQISLTHAGLFDAKIVSTNHSTFPLHHLAESCHSIDLDFFSYNRLKCKGYRQLTLSLPSDFGPCYPIFLNACWFR